MKLKKISANVTELHKSNGDIVLVSYETPVAAFINGQGFYETSCKYSVTTSKHISQFFKRHGFPPRTTMTPEALGELI